MTVTHSIIVAAALAGVAGAALAQGAPTYDPSQLPSVQGTVAQYSLTPRGDVDGLILADGTEVHMPPHLGTALVYAVKPGDRVTVRGLKARALPMVDAMSIQNDATGTRVSDDGPSGGLGRGMPEQALRASGRIKAQLHGVRGEVNGLLLQDGTIVRLPPAEIDRLASAVAPGGVVVVAGEGSAGLLGRVIEGRSIGANEASMTTVAPPPPPGPGRRGPRIAADAPPPPPPDRIGAAPAPASNRVPPTGLGAPPGTPGASDPPPAAGSPAPAQQ